ncbi:hypothetical protein BH23BAC1_BH23BAC1_50520 [soil metagenome]
MPIEEWKRKCMELEKQEAEQTADLKAKYRELEIEACLERVRAKTMAMHKSSEIREVASTMYTELRKLDFQYGACTIILMMENSMDMEWWIGGFEEGEFPQAYRISFFEHPVYRNIWEGWKHEENFRVIQLKGKSKKSFDQELFFHNGFKDLTESVKAWMLAQTSVIFSLAYMKHGALHWGPDP